MRRLMLRPLSPRWLDVVLFLGFVAIILALSGCSLYAPTGERPLTLKEQVYQTGGVLIGIGQEIDFAIRNGTIPKESAAAKQLVQTYEITFQLYRRTATLVMSDEHQAATARLELLRLIDALRRDLTAALVKP